MTEESAVKVCVRVRPLIAREEGSSENAEPVQLFWRADKKSIHQLDDGNFTKSFSFDRVFIAEETTNQLYQDIAKPLVVSSVEGYNGTIFAYGQTSSGKTFTMMGNNHILGVIPLAVEDVFQTIKNCPKKEFLLRVSYMEIYNETVTDLLVDSWKRKPLEVRETINKNIYVADLTEELVTSPSQALAWIRKGEKNRHYGKTKMNERSSRSHTIFRMILESRERSDPASGENADGAIIVSHLNLVDLAGSERASQTGAEGTRFKEGCNINRSLFTLGQVIKKLTDEGQRGFTNYRDSKLTRILQNSLGGNAKTVIICTITPVTLDETLSTLQFASTAKKMKNDPHVTEVSDDGALLKRYRNEIVDLKRRLHEVSSVTQTTATEKKVLSQLLQEKDQLQREQEDRIRNLTKLLVTSSNLVPAQRMPKRRVTWGGKMLKLVRASSCEGSPSNLSFAESLTRKRKADCSNLTELVEDDEDFDSQWEIPDEPPDDMEMSQGAVTVRTSADRLDSRVVELQQQLQTLEQQKQEAAEKLTVTEQSAATLCLQLQTEAQQKLEAVEKVEMLELAVADLERRVREEGNSDTQVRREFAETVQLCETLATEKDVVAAERDYLKQELGLFIEQTESLEREKASLSLELQKKRELDEFESLEDEVRKEHESELQRQMVSLKMAKESSELQCLELQKKLDTVSQELKEKTQFAEDLQSMSGKDLVQEVAKLRRSLDDAEVLSRDTKKEWAILRSQNISLEEMKLSLAAGHEKMEAEVGTLRSQLEAEKSQYRKMQTDLQRELNAAFVENNKLLTLLEGKIPKDVMDCVQLERSVSSLHQELAASREAEGALREQLEELASLRALPDQMSSMKKQLEQLTEELGCVRAEKDALLFEQNVSESEIKDLLSTLSSLTSERDQLKTGMQQNVERVAETQACLQALQEDLEVQRQKSADLVKLHEQKESEYEERIVSLSEELQGLQEDKQDLLQAGVESSAEELRELLSTLTAERDQLRVDLQENVEMMIEHQEELRTALEKNNEQRKRIKDLETAPTSDLERATTTSSSSSQLEELQTQLESLSEELDSVRADRDLLQSQRPTQEMEMGKLHSTLTSLTEERDQLQEILEGLRQEKQQLREELEDRIHTITDAQAGFMQAQTLDSLLPPHDQRAADLQQEVEQLMAALHAFGEQKVQHEAELQLQAQKAAESQKLLQALQEELQQQAQRSLDLERSGQEQRAQLEQQVAETQACLQALQEDLEVQRQKSADLVKLHEQKESEYEERIVSLSEELQGLQEDKQDLLQAGVESSAEELRELLSTLTAERDQLRVDLQENVEMMIEHQEELRTALEKNNEQQKHIKDLETAPTSDLERATTSSSSSSQLEELQTQLKSLSEELDSVRADRDLLQSQRPTQEMEMGKLHSTLTSLTEERDQLQEILEGLRQEKQQLREELEDRIHTITDAQAGFMQAQTLDSLLPPHDQRAADLQQEVEQLMAALHAFGEQKVQHEAELQLQAQKAAESQKLLQALQEELQQQARRSLDLEISGQEQRAQLEQQITESENALHSRQESFEEQIQKNADLLKIIQQKESDLEQQTKELELLQAQRVELLHSEETEKLLSTLTEDRKHLQQQEQQLRAQLQDRMEEHQLEVAELRASLQTVTEQKRRLEDDLQESKKMASTAQDLLKVVQQEQQDQKQLSSDLMSTLQSSQAERDVLLAEKEATRQVSAEEQQKLLSVTGERDQLQEILEVMRQEKQQLREELEDKMRTLGEELEGVAAERDGLHSACQSSREEMEQLRVRLRSESEELLQLHETLDKKEQLRSQLEDQISSMEEKLHEQEELMLQQQSETARREASFQQEMEEQLKTFQEAPGISGSVSATAAAEASLQVLTQEPKQTSLCGLQDSILQLQESFRRFQQFMDVCSQYDSSAMEKELGAPSRSHQSLLPQETQRSYRDVCQLQLQSLQHLGEIGDHLQERAKKYRDLFEQLVQRDLCVFEERLLQDVLLCRAQDFTSLWRRRLTQLLEHRGLYLQKMESTLQKLWDDMATYPSELSVEFTQRKKFGEQLMVVWPNQKADSSQMDRLLESELKHLSSVAQSRKRTLQSIVEEHNGVSEELQQLLAAAEAQLREETSKRQTLQQELQAARPRTASSTMKDNQQLDLQLQQAEDQIEALRAENQQLEEAQTKAQSRVSNHKRATQLLQTELQDSRAQVEEKENIIQTLRSKLGPPENAGVELDRLRTNLFRVEMEMSSASEKHQQEIVRLSTVLTEKEESVRKLKEALRKSQQQGEESFLEGGELCARLTNPKGLVIKSSVLLEKGKLEEEVQQLQLQITQLESLVSSQQSEIAKWKSRAVKLKVKTKAVVDKSSPTCTPTKRGPPMTSDSFLNSPKKFLVTPKKVLDSPRKLLDYPMVSLLDSPKSRFFDVAESSELLSRTCPKQFFDNSSLGTVPDGAEAADRKDEWWPQSPKQEDMCRTQ